MRFRTSVHFLILFFLMTRDDQFVDGEYFDYLA